ncbi:MAG: AAA family ATPase [Bacilli bacterium]
MAMSEYINGSKLSQVKSPLHDEVVHDLLSVGVTVLGAPQKIGKTFFCLQLSNAIAEGKTFLEHDVEQGRVVYCALEDTKDKIKKRYELFGFEASSNIDFIFFENSNDFRLEYEVKNFINQYKNIKLFVIDTFAKMRNKNTEAKYLLEYDEVSKIHALALKFNIAIILVTHVNKLINYANPFDSIYGSRGVTAAADGMMVMLKEKSNHKLKNLFIVGKDISEQRLLLQQDDKLLYSITNIVDDEIEDDEDITKVIHYVVRKKEYVGTHENLCAILNLKITSKKLSNKIKVYKNILEENYIKVERPQRKAGARLIQLKYDGCDGMTD